MRWLQIFCFSEKAKHKEKTYAEIKRGDLFNYNFFIMKNVLKLGLMVCGFVLATVASSSNVFAKGGPGTTTLDPSEGGSCQPPKDTICGHSGDFTAYGNFTTP